MAARLESAGRSQPLIGIANHDILQTRLLTDVLQRQGFRSVILPEGSTGYEVVKKEKPDLVLLDASPDNGDDTWTLFQLLRMDDQTVQIPILILTDTDGHAQTAANLKHHLSVRVLPQPDDPEVLVPNVRGMLEENESSRPGQAQ